MKYLEYVPIGHGPGVCEDCQGFAMFVRVDEHMRVQRRLCWEHTPAEWRTYWGNLAAGQGNGVLPANSRQ